MTREEWLSCIEEGTKVAVDTSIGDVTSYVIAEVVRVTKTLIKTNKGDYRRDDGYSPGKSFRRTQIVPLTDEVIQVLNREIYVNRIRKTNLKNLTYDQLKRINDILKEGR